MADPDREEVLRERALAVCSANLGCKDRHPYLCEDCERILAALRQTAEEAEEPSCGCRFDWRTQPETVLKICDSHNGLLVAARAEGKRAGRDAEREEIGESLDASVLQKHNLATQLGINRPDSPLLIELAILRDLAAAIRARGAEKESK